MLLDKTLKFSDDIRELCEDDRMQFIDAVIHWCEKNNLEVEYAASLIDKDMVIKSKIQAEAENLNYLKKSSRLPI